MKKILLGSVSAIALTCSVHAADLPMKAPPAPPPLLWSWTGFYVGVHGGVVSHKGEFDDLGGFFNGSPIAPVTYSATKTGGMFGGHLGYNWQSGSVVYGLEGDFSGLWAKGGARGRPLFDSLASFDVNWLATIRARLGVTVSNATLLYVTGGVAFADVSNQARVTDFGPGYIMTVDKVKTGWTAGGGIEHRFAGNWTARLEGRYVDLGNSSTLCAPAGNGNCNLWQYRGDFSNSLLIGLAGVSLKF
jgi:outer membrane immunogenic protein